ncbi:VanZ family protein (plasmid) [Streptomyces sp. BI20]|uniref:VanZ family protein n=1 Tax=Streptomyces sp. BI20 TaxID=3403460 RepID=UPI003C755E34
MIETLLRAHPDLAVAAVLASLLAGLAGWWTARRLGRGERRERLGRGGPGGLLGALTGAALAVVLTATLYPVAASAPASGTCFVTRDLVSGTFTAQGVMNVLLFLPLAAFGAWTTRRPVPVALGCVGLSAVIEVAQALTPGVGRACDSTDLWTNALGAALGAGLAAAGPLRRAARARTGVAAGGDGRGIRRSLVGCAVGMTALGLTAAATVTFVPSEVAWADTADAEQERAARDAVVGFLGEDARIATVQFFQDRGRLVAATDRGNLELAWPSREVTSGFLHTPGTSPPAGRAPTPVDDATARATAEGFVREHFPWALVGRTSVAPSEEAGPAGKRVSWRSRKNGVLMPLRVDVVVGPGRTVVSFEARRVPDPVLPAARVDWRRAETLAAREFPGEVVRIGELTARTDENGDWRPYWPLDIGPSDAPSPGAATTTDDGGPPGDGPEAPAAPAPSGRLMFLDALTAALTPATATDTP